MQVNLVTAQGALVERVVIPEFRPPATVLIWGVRVFVHAGYLRHTPVMGLDLEWPDDVCFVEQFAYIVPERSMI